MKRKFGLIMPVDDALIPAGYIFPQSIEDVSENLKKLTFPDGFYCYAPYEPGEASFIYNEIIAKQEYFQHGLSVAGARCVFDVGANIGIFTLAVKMQAPQAAVYAFEPIPDTFQVLERNVQSHGHADVHLFNLAIGSQDHTEKSFIFYPNMPGNATTNPALKVAQKQVTDYIFGKEASDYMNVSEPRQAQVRTLSAIIDEQGITAIDYLKVDTEGAEMEVLAGIAERHWPMIRQVVVETHSPELRLQVSQVLADHGFQIYSDGGIAAAAGDTNVYACR